MISLTWSTEEKLFCAFVESIIISVWLTVCLVEFCSYTQTESYLITWDFREGALKYHQERSDCLGAWRILLGRCRTSFSKLLWEVTRRDILQWLKQAAQEQDLKLVLVRLSSGSTAESLGERMGLDSSLVVCEAQRVLWFYWADLQCGSYRCLEMSELFDQT